MRLQRAHRRPQHARLGIPAALAGTLAGAFAAVPATASEVEPASAARSATTHSSAHRSVSRAPVQPLAATAAGAAAAAGVRPLAARPADYVVAPGDTVWSIAQRFGLRTADVLAWNGLTGASIIHPGQRLRLAAPSGAAPAPAQSPAPAPASGAKHTVVAGDTVFGIARRYGTSVSAILSANGLSSGSIIYPGQTLVIPAATGAAPAPAANPQPAPAPAPASATRHTVVAGDTLFGIARRYGTTVATLFALNGLSAASIIYPGQTLIVAGAPAPASPAPASPAPASVPDPASTGPRTAVLNDKQIENARMIIRIGRELGVSDRGIAIALATSMVEAWLRNLDWGDRDSLGLFQQRPSTGWGTPDQIRDRDRSIRAFFGGASDPNGTATRGLLDIPGWERMSFTDAAQAVQVSAYPERYGQWEAQAYEWLRLYG